MTRRQLLRDVWRLNHEPETNSVEVHASRLRGKLAEFGCDGLVATDPRGGYRLHDEAYTLGSAVPEDDSLDAYLRRHNLWPAEAECQDG